MRCYLEVPMSEEDEKRRDLCPTCCPALHISGMAMGEKLTFKCNAMNVTYLHAVRELEYTLVGGTDHPQVIEVKRHGKCPIKTSATPVW